ncbi:hypothetical protein LOTGIDRAFT_188948 [Lottia gigantea]|uniref:Exosome component 7 n=1 Tax=Lottia gigantea TaxID=225164 RepID=V3ZUC3_LOTGI|nr:hypothetical protein LOTGIDRAFT_188948 [Lottia gigantea]ESO95083.1 hypothetical protein LOTGIDRAFT_188948 [Lottia gigantea]
MTDIIYSEAEKTYILHGIQENYREDGRGCEDYRHMEIETGVVSNTTGSARVRLANTDLLVGIKAELGSPSPDNPNCGCIEFFVDCSANATPQFEGRGGEELATEISNVLTRAYSNSTSLDLKSLCIIPKQQCWILYIDVLFLECGGNLFDAASVGVKAALFNTKIPNVTVNQDEDDMEIELSDDPFDVQRIDIKSAPCIVTLSKIGHHHVVDASQKEEACCLARLMMGVTADSTITALKKEGWGSLNPESIFEMMESGKNVGKVLNASLLSLLEDEEKGSKRKTVGFLK